MAGLVLEWNEGKKSYPLIIKDWLGAYRWCGKNLQYLMYTEYPHFFFRYPLMLGEVAHSSTSKEKDIQKGETRRITSTSRIKGTKGNIETGFMQTCDIVKIHCG